MPKFAEDYLDRHPLTVIFGRHPLTVILGRHPLTAIPAKHPLATIFDRGRRGALACPRSAAKPMLQSNLDFLDF